MKKALNLAIDIIYYVFLFWTISTACIEIYIYSMCLF